MSFDHVFVCVCISNLNIHFTLAFLRMLQRDGFSSESNPADSIDSEEALGKPDGPTPGVIILRWVKVRSRTYFPFILKRRQRSEV